MPDRRHGASQLGFARGSPAPSEYRSPGAKARFAIAKYYGMGSDGQWTVEEIANALDVTPRQVYNYLSESEIGRETREIQTVTEAEWRLDAALHLRKEIDRLEEVEQELLQRTTTAPTDFEERAIEGTPTDAGQVLSTDDDDYSLTISVPIQYEEVTEYDSDLERLHKEKRQHIEQICTLLGLYDSPSVDSDSRPSAEGSDEWPVVEYRARGDADPESGG